MVICLNYGQFEKKFRSVVVIQNHYHNKIFDIHPFKKNYQLLAVHIMLATKGLISDFLRQVGVKSEWTCWNGKILSVFFSDYYTFTT